MAGLVTPDHFVLRRRPGPLGWRVIERRPGRREVIIRPRPGGGTEMATAGVGLNTLPDRVLYRLAGLGKAIEAHFGRPQDIEWAWAGGKIYILQARPITALPEPVDRVSRPVRLMAALLAELLPARPYPLELTTWTAALCDFPAQAFRLFGFRALPLNELFAEQDGIAVRLRARFWARPTPAVLLAPFRLLLRLLRAVLRYDPARWRSDPLLAETIRRARKLEVRDFTSLSPAELLATVRQALEIPRAMWNLRLRYALAAAPALGLLWLWLRLIGRPGLFSTLVFTGVETRILQMNRTLEALAVRIRVNPELADVFARCQPGELWNALGSFPAGQAFLAEFKAFLDEYGHRETGGSLQAFPPTWKEAPEVVLGILKALAAGEPAAGPQQPPLEQALAHPLLGTWPAKAVFLRLLERARLFHQVREDTRFYAMLGLPVLRRALLELGRRLAGVGVLSRSEDVFYLRLEEVERAVSAWPPAPELAEGLRWLVVRRKLRWLELEGVPFVDPRLLGRGEPTGDVLVGGIPGSPGVAEGPVCVIRDPSEFGKLRPGDVLVAPYTNPAWTPLFGRAAAVVVESGGPASHAAIVAREYGLPAVMGARDATRRLADGRRVRVDGTRGLVLRPD